uniref:Sulfatase N-terminal domain-containing protein n=1 Tax=Trichuris muris TaxID=70415 RepID=A0A5S6R123_TRIMR
MNRKCLTALSLFLAGKTRRHARIFFCCFLTALLFFVCTSIVPSSSSKCPHSDLLTHAKCTIAWILKLLPEVDVVEGRWGKLRSYATIPSTNGICVTQSQHMDDPEISRLIYVPKPLSCAKENNWVYVKNGYFFIKPEAIARHGRITCNFQPVIFADDLSLTSWLIKGVHSNSSAPTDFMKIACKAKDGENYENYHATVVPKQDVLNRVEQQSPGALPVNVYILAFDSVSRLHFMRKMRESYNYITAVLKGTVLEKYNILGDGTTAAIIPLLTGKTEMELPVTLKTAKNASHVDAYPFIWNEFKKMGYATFYGEDGSKIGTFTYRLKGFKRQPTDHYMRVFYQMTEGSNGYRLCYGSEPQVQVHLDYVKEFLEAYKRKLKFAFQFHSAYSHDDVNMLSLADDTVKNHLKFLHENNHLNNTILVVMSDHGPRFSSIRRTSQGKLEELNPFVSVILPSWFRQAYPDLTYNLQINGKRLATPFDLYATWKSILNFPPPKSGNLNQRGISLFSEIPAVRQCHHADIEPQWCPCLVWKKVSNDTIFAWYAAQQIVHAINKRLKRQQHLCVPLRLHSVIDVQLSQQNNEYISLVESAAYVRGFLGRTFVSRYVTYRLSISTYPGNAVYETTIILDTTTNLLQIDVNLVSRINAYGSKPHCILDIDASLAKWCVCYDKLR